MLKGTLQGSEIADKISHGEDDCEVCEGARLAGEILSKIVCPHCGEPLYDGDGIATYVMGDSAVIGTDNSCDIEKQVYRRAEIVECRVCGGRVALMPTAICYNANHGIYYTGSGKYLPRALKFEDRRLRDAFEPCIEQYLRRTAAGEKIEPYLLAIWCSYEAERVVAEMLKEWGLTP